MRAGLSVFTVFAELGGLSRRGVGRSRNAGVVAGWRLPEEERGERIEGKICQRQAEVSKVMSESVRF